MVDRMSPTEYLILLREKRSMTWREIAAQPEFQGIPPGSLCAFYKGNWQPKDNAVRRQLGLTEIITAEVKRDKKGRFSR